MNAKELKKELMNLADIVFTYNGKRCGATNELIDDDMCFFIWYDQEEHQHKNVDSLMKDKLFDEKSLEDIADQLDIEIS